jgi:hypothetical protein
MNLSQAACEYLPTTWDAAGATIPGAARGATYKNNVDRVVSRIARVETVIIVRAEGSVAVVHVLK